MKNRRLIESLFFLGFCGFYLTLWPGPLSPVVGGLDNFDWDSGNILTWQWATQTGQVPFLEFWYPYFCRIYVQAHNLVWALEIVQIGILYFCFVFFCKSEELFAALFFWTLAAAFFCQFPGAWHGSMRYLLGLSSVWLIVAALEAREARPKAPVLPILAGGWLGNAFFLEPPQAVSAFLCVLPVPFFLYFQKKEKTSDCLKAIGFLLFGSACTAGIWCGILVATGNLTAFWWQVCNLQHHANSCLWPASLITWWKITVKPENMVLLLTIAGLGLGVYGIMAAPKKSKEVFLILLVTTIFSALIFFKHLVRPHMALQFLIIPTAGLGLVVCRLLCEKLAKPAGRLFCFLACGAGASIFIPFGEILPRWSLATWVKKIMTSPNIVLGENLKSEIEIMLGTKGAQEFREAKSVYVLGDNSFWYILKRQTTPPYISFYDMAPAYAQRRTIEWLEIHRPEMVIWEPGKDQFDGVPNTVRCPLIFDYMVRNYFVDEASGSDRFRVLKIQKNKGSSSNAHIKSWIKNLGNQVDYGLIPTAFHSFASKDDDLRVSVIRISESGGKGDKLAGTPEKAFVLDFRDGNRWEIQFCFPPGTGSATVRLDRMWFYSFYAAQIDTLDFQTLAVNNSTILLEKKRISVDSRKLY